VCIVNGIENVHVGDKIQIIWNPSEDLGQVTTGVVTSTHPREVELAGMLTLELGGDEQIIVLERALTERELGTVAALNYVMDNYHLPCPVPATAKPYDEGYRRGWFMGVEEFEAYLHHIVEQIRDGSVQI
jgi:hypothetical protein